MYKGWKREKEEDIRIPEAYVNKERCERIEEASELLQRMQNLFNMEPRVQTKI